MRVILFLFSLSLLLVSSCSHTSKPVGSQGKNETSLEFVPNTWGGSGYTWAADFNGDGKTDIASADSGTVYMYLSTGMDFELSNWTVPNAWGGSDYTWTADFNGDGKADIASANGSSIYMHLSTGNNFSNSTWTVPNAWGGSDYTWAADFNGDGKADIASANGGNIYVHLSTGSSFSNSTWTVPNAWGGSDYTWAADFNGDGASGIASANGGNIYMHLSTGSNFDNQTWTVPGNWGGSGYTWTGDFNGDGYMDIASANGNAVYMSLSRGERFANETWYSAAGSSGSSAQPSSGVQLTEKQAPLNADVTGSRTLYKCGEKFGVGTWAVNFDTRRHLNYSMTLKELGWTKEVYGPSDISSADDGLYIFVLHRQPKTGGTGGYATLRIRRSDRPDDVGFSVQGDKAYSYTGNIPCPNTSPSCALLPGEKAETPHQFVRHTQLNQGTGVVYSAGQLQIRGGQIIWINNASGHFAPSMGSLDCVEEYLDMDKVPRTTYRFKRDRTWTDWTLPHDEL